MKHMGHIGHMGQLEHMKHITKGVLFVKKKNDFFLVANGTGFKSVQ
jgi:hypothetical protein